MQMDYFEEWAKNWEVTEQSKVVAEIFVKELIGRDSNLILDLGSGKGVLRDFFYKYAPKSRIVYIDKAFAMIKGLRENYPEEMALRGEGERLPLRENKFDAVIIFNSFPHFKGKKEVVSECYRVLKSGGRLIIGHSMTPGELNDMHRQINEDVAKHQLPEKNAFITMLSKAGFKGIEYFVTDYFYIMGFKE
jgi:ubiquinone/menaquinone biosynthesis C-methylase UbiE